MTAALRIVRYTALTVVVLFAAVAGTAAVVDHQAVNEAVTKHGADVLIALVAVGLLVLHPVAALLLGHNHRPAFAPRGRPEPARRMVRGGVRSGGRRPRHARACARRGRPIALSHLPAPAQYAPGRAPVLIVVGGEA